MAMHGVTSKRGLRAILALAFTLLGLPLAAQRGGDDAYQRIYLDPALATADYDAHLATLLEVIKPEPAGAAAITALRRAMRMDDRCTSMKPLYTWLEARAREDFKGCGPHSDDYCEAYIDLARRYAPDLYWHEVARKRRGVIEWAYIGPFAEGFTAAHDDTYPPEVMLDLEGAYPGAHETVRWKPLRHDDPLRGRVDLWSQERWGGAGYYLATAFISDSDRELFVRIQSQGSGKLWLNGEYLLDIDTRGIDWPQLWLPVTIKRGRNVLLFKVSGLNPVSVALRTQDGAVPGGVVTQAPKAGDPRVPILSGTPRHAMPMPPEHEAMHFAAYNRGATATQSGCAHFALAAMFEAHGMRWQAAEHAVTARSLLQEQAPAQLEFLRALENSPLHSTSERRRLGVEITDALLAADPVMPAAAIEKARILAEDQRYREAVQLLEAARRKHAGNWRLNLALSEVYRGADWRSEWLRELAGNDDALPVLRARVRLYARFHELANRAAVERRILELVPGDRDAMLGLCNTLLRMGESSEALKLARKLATADPGNSGSLETLAEALVASGRIEEAIETWEELGRRSARPEDSWEDAARACLRLGREKQALALLERVVAASPGRHSARRQLLRMKGESEDYYSQHALAWDEIMKHDVTAADFPRTHSVLILDEAIDFVYPDGSSVSYVHIVRKILTQQGVDDRGKDRIPGELITARTIKPDGTVLEPITQAGGTVEFPGVEPGCWLDIAYIVRNEAGPRRTLDGNRFFFCDTDLLEPFAISRWVMIAPADMKFSFAYHNLGPDDEGVSIHERRDGARVVRTWDVRKPVHVDYEPFMPPALEFIPWVECVVQHQWGEPGRSAAERGLRERRSTGLIRFRADEITQGLEGDVARARAIYRWVNATFTTDGEARNAHQAINADAGDREGTFLALCHAAGIKLAFAMADAAPPYKTAEPDDLPRPRFNHPRRDDFQHFLAVVYDGDKPVYIDLADRLRPFGVLSSRLAHAPAFLWRQGNVELVYLPGGQPEDDRFEYSVKIELAEDGSATLAGKSIIRGERSYGLKEIMRISPHDESAQQLEREVASHYPGFTVKECRFPGLNDVQQPLVREFEGSVRRMARKDGDALVMQLPGEKLVDLLSVLVELERRRHDMLLPFDFNQVDEIRIKPPAGYAFGAIPAELVMPTAPLIYSLKFRMDGNELVMSRKMLLGPGRLTTADYADLVEQVKLISAAEAVRLRVVKQ